MGLLKHISRIFKPQKKWLYRIENGIAYDRNGNVVEELSSKETSIVFDGLLYENGDFVGETIISISFGGEVHTTRHATNENWFEVSERRENANSCEREPNSNEVKVPLEGLIEKYGTAITDDIFKQIQDCRKEGYNNIVLKNAVFEQIEETTSQSTNLVYLESERMKHVELMMLYFKSRHENSDNFELSTYHAKQAMILGHNSGFVQNRLVINLEKTGSIYQAIQLCDIVLSHKHVAIRDDYDFSNRKKRLQKNISKAIDTENDYLFTDEELEMVVENSKVQWRNAQTS